MHWFYVTWLVKCWLDHYSDVISGNGFGWQAAKHKSKGTNNPYWKRFGLLHCFTYDSPVATRILCLCRFISNGPASEVCNLEKISMNSAQDSLFGNDIQSAQGYQFHAYLWNQMSVFTYCVYLCTRAAIIIQLINQTINRKLIVNNFDNWLFKSFLKQKYQTVVFSKMWAFVAFSVLYHSKLNIFGFWSVGETKKAIFTLGSGKCFLFYFISEAQFIN